MNSTSIQERLQLKREPIDKWSLREQLSLASAVVRSGDQNWMSVSRALKPFIESNRPADWWHQKNCAVQYNALLTNVETPKRKKRIGVETVIVETPGECILKRLIADRQIELTTLLAEEKAEYKKLQEDMKLLQSGRVTEEQLDKWCKEIDEEENKCEQESINHAKWLKQRELRKQEIERAWRVKNTVIPSIVGQKRKTPEDEFVIDNNERSESKNMQYTATATIRHPLSQKVNQFGATNNNNNNQSSEIITQESKPALSPLLTSLLKSPSQVSVSASTTILHNVITCQAEIFPECKITTSTTTTPTMVNLLNNSITSNLTMDDANNSLNSSDLLDDANLKIDDLAKSMLQDEPFPEIKREEVDDIISEIIENNRDLVVDPEQHLQLDGNGDININLGPDDDEMEQEQEEIRINKENSVVPDQNIEDVKKLVETEKTDAKTVVVVDPFEFQEDPIIFDSPVKPCIMKQENSQYTPLYQPQQPINPPSAIKIEVIEENNLKDVNEKPYCKSDNEDDKVEAIIVDLKNTNEIALLLPPKKEGKEDEDDVEKALVEEIIQEEKDNEMDEEKVQTESSESSVTDDTEHLALVEPKNENVQNGFESKDVTLSIPQSSRSENSDFVDDLYDNLNMEVKIDKTGKTKRDYSRPKKKEEKNFDVLLAMEKAQLDFSEDLTEFKVMEAEKREIVTRTKTESQRSSSPWTEDDDDSNKPLKRRYSTSVTPVDSLPNSPASSTTFNEDDKEYRNWKKSVMLVYNRLASNKYASLFLKPITEEQAPGYDSIVYRPMDLHTIKKHIDTGIVRTSLEFKRDVMLMFTNAIMYNKTNDTVYDMALQMQQESMGAIEILLEAAEKMDVPSRRETRTSESGIKRKRLTEESSTLKLKKKKDE